GRVSQSSALLQLVLVKTMDVMPRCRLDDLISGIKRLQNDLPATFTATCASCHLSQHLKDSFACKGIWQVQANIRQDDTHQRNKREIEPLGEHLRADQHIGAVRGEV